jgi:hypothetical protein
MIAMPENDITFEANGNGYYRVLGPGFRDLLKNQPSGNCAILANWLDMDSREFPRMGDLERNAEFACLQFVTQQGAPQPIAILLLDHEGDILYVRARKDFSPVADAEDARVLQATVAQLAEDAKGMSGRAILEDLESTLSNSLLITERTSFRLDDCDGALEELYSKHICVR